MVRTTPDITQLSAERVAEGIPAPTERPVTVPPPSILPPTPAGPVIPRQVGPRSLTDAEVRSNVSPFPPRRPGLGRVRGMVIPDVVSFTAHCPACGADCTWIEERDDTRLRVTIDCDCPDPAA